jgi:putative transcriptional regulator
MLGETNSAISDWVCRRLSQIFWKETRQAMSKLGKRLIKAAQEARAIARGEADPKTYKISVPREINVKALRTRMRMTQEQFAARYNLNVARVRDWEQGRSQPDGAVRAYLTVIEQEPNAVERALRKAS